MGFNNPAMPWRDLERILSDQPVGDGGDSPAWSRKRPRYEPPPLTREPGGVPYAELHCHSSFSFLDGASPPDALAEEAARLGLTGLALTDHDGFYGVVRFAEAARAVGLPTVFGAELSLGLPRPQNGVADPQGTHLLVLARGPAGYASLARAMSEAHLAGGEKGRPRYDVARLAELSRDWVVLTGCRKGAVRAALDRGGVEEADRALAGLRETFGDRVVVELTDRGDPLDCERNDALAALATRHGLPYVATNDVHHATPEGHRLATVVAAVRARRSLDEADGWLPPNAAAHLRSGAEQARRFARWPGAVETSVDLAAECAFDLSVVAPRLPPCPVPEGHTEMSWLRHLTYEGALRPYGPRHAETAPGAYAQLDKELDVIEAMGFAGYFLIVRDIVEFCRREDIFCQGRGSAANSAVCYVIGITAVDSVRLKLLFERFLSPHRDGPPDIDLDIENGRREEVIQYVYSRYGRENAAQVANVITYRPRSAIREVGRAFGYPEGQLDAWSKQVDGWTRLSQQELDVPEPVLEQAMALQEAPRHLGIHSGGMVICDRPVVEVCPVEWARMPGRTVLQWDKDDCAATGLVKFDLLGLGMLTALHGTFDLMRRHHGVDLDLASIPQEDPEVYEMLCRADSVGVFQVESRAQMATLPRLRPKEFFDLVIEVALIRPGPIQGGSVHPYIRRRHGKEPVTYLHPLLEPALEKTLGVPLFQEQLMQIAVDVAGFTPADADELRIAMGAKRSKERMARLRERLMAGMARNDVPPDVAEAIYAKLVAFANYGFPESHSVSFAYLVYASAWLKLRYPAAFLAALLNAQPMGFYSPQSLVADAQRHGVTVRSVDVNASKAKADLEPDGAVRLGLEYVRTLGKDLAARIEAGQPYASMADMVRRARLTEPQVEALATAGAFGCFGLSRRAALWAAGAVAVNTPDRLDGLVAGAEAPPLPAMTPLEETVADVWATGLTADGHVVSYVRPFLDSLGAVNARDLRAVRDRTRVWVGGAVIHRQRPATAGGTTFVNLEDETGHVNVICSPGVWRRYRRVARASPGLLVRGLVETADGVCNVVADRIEPLTLSVAAPSRDFH
ncbi:MAG TPA: error-prone DNA polymerase [Mycobacteriales bacterium]|jgi:error-prone DNA polymerase